MGRFDRPRYHFGDHPWDYPALGFIASLLVLLGLLFVTPATGQTVDHRAIVAAAKQQLIAEGWTETSEPGECPRFRIVQRVVWELRDEGAGTLSKPTGNNCEAQAVDIVAYRDGTIVDILCGGVEGSNTPCWSVNPNRVDPGRWRPPATLPTTTPTLPPPTPTSTLGTDPPDLAAVTAKLDQLLYAVEQLQKQGEANGQKTEHVEARLNEVVAGAKSLGVKMLPWLAAGVAGGACVAR